MSNRIPNTAGNEHSKKGGKKHSGKDPHASSAHHEFNKHHKLAHGMGEVEESGHDEGDGAGHEECYNKNCTEY